MNKFKILILIVFLIFILVAVFFLGRSFGKDEGIGGALPKAVENQAVLIGNQRIVFGDQNAPVTIVGYFDLSIPESSHAYLAITRLMNENRTENRSKIFFVYRHFPDVESTISQEAAKTIEAARILGKLYPMIDLLIAKQSVWSKSPDAPKLFISYAKELGMEEAPFKEKLIAAQDAVYSDITSARAVGVKSPTIFVNGKPIANPNYENLKKEVDAIPWPSPTVTPTPIATPTENPSPTETPTEIPRDI